MCAVLARTPAIIAENDYWKSDPFSIRNEVFSTADVNTYIYYVQEDETEWFAGADPLRNFLCEEYCLIDQNSNYYQVVDGVLFSKDMTRLYAYPPMKQGRYYRIPATVKSVEGDAFAGSYYLRELVVPDSIINMDGQGCVFYESCVETIHFPPCIERFDLGSLDYLPNIKTIHVARDSYLYNLFIEEADYIDYLSNGVVQAY